MPLMFHDDLAFFRETLRAVNHIADGGADVGKAVWADVTRRGWIDAPAGAWTPARLSGRELSGLTSDATVTVLSREMV
ncbi:MAG TPA: hypothetical protein VHJ79_13550 [Mycobacterium sp.]|jgi:hypothetical protein|nr:hypothetical protein [Mycobacterium sp.]